MTRNVSQIGVQKKKCTKKKIFEKKKIWKKKNISYAKFVGKNSHYHRKGEVPPPLFYHFKGTPLTFFDLSIYDYIWIYIYIINIIIYIHIYSFIIIFKHSAWYIPYIPKNEKNPKTIISINIIHIWLNQQTTLKPHSNHMNIYENIWLYMIIYEYILSYIFIFNHIYQKRFSKWSPKTWVYSWKSLTVWIWNFDFRPSKLCLC